MSTLAAPSPEIGDAPINQNQMMRIPPRGGGGGSARGGAGVGGSSSAASLPGNQHPIVLSSAHQDYIHNLSFDTYGRRMATCSGDRMVKVWDLLDDGEWALSASYQAHRGSVSTLCWAHPEFGTLLATGGLDQEAKVWEERSSIIGPNGSGGGGGSTSTIQHRWNTRASLTEARRAVTCVEFAPRHWGLKLAVASADGAVRIYEAVDIMNLSQWPLAATLQAFDDDCTSLSWCTARFEPPTLVAGGGSSHSLVIYRYIEASRAWQPLMQLEGSSAAACVPMQVLCTSWAPNVGRRFHYIAAAQGETLQIHKLLRTTQANAQNNQNSGGGGAASSDAPPNKLPVMGLELESTQAIPVNAWRCQWNVTGTVLASSGDSGVVHMYKSNLDGVFECVSKVVVGGSHPNL